MGWRQWGEGGQGLWWRQGPLLVAMWGIHFPWAWGCLGPGAAQPSPLHLWRYGKLGFVEQGCEFITVW